jgi:Arc/MetJ family transcription regulator
MGNVKRTSLFLDRDLVAVAAQALGTAGTTATIHAALSEVGRLEDRRRLVETDPTFGMSLEELLAERRRTPPA